MHEIAVSHHLAALSAGPGRVRQDLRHEVNRLGGQHQHHPNTTQDHTRPPKERDPRFRLSSRGDGAGLTMRPSRRPTVTRNGRASIVAWFPQTPQPDAHHIHYRIRSFWEVMIVTRLRPRRCRAHPSARLSRVFTLAPPAARCNFSRLFPPARLYSSACSRRPGCFFWPPCTHHDAPRCTTVPFVSPHLERDFFDEPRAEVTTCIRVQLAPRRRRGASGKNVAVGHGNTLFRPIVSTMSTMSTT